ncbi:MAG: hypothetical protein IIA23_08580 [Chloroflexi bacterium]|nr:hypothetical protein [Chloroflexota bacterium]
MADVTNNCPTGVATQDPKLRARLHVEASAEKLARFLGAAVDLMKVMAWACGHDDLQKFNLNDLTTWKREMVELSGVRFGGVGGSSR